MGRKSLDGLKCLLCSESSDAWHDVLTVNKKLMIKVCLCARHHIQVHRLNPSVNKKFVTALKSAVKRLKLVVVE